MTCFESTQLLERVLEGELAGDALLHAAECPACGRLLMQLRQLADALHGFRFAQPPRDVIQRASALVERQGWLGRLVESVRTALVLDSAEMAPVPVRSLQGGDGHAEAAGRFLRFESGPWVAELHHLSTGVGSHDLAGRLMQADREAPFAVLARGASGRIYPRMSDDVGHFHFPNLPPDSYEIVLELDHADVLLGPLALG